MPAVKLNADTLAVLAALRGRFAFGHSYDKSIQALVHRYLEGADSAIVLIDILKQIREDTAAIREDVAVIRRLLEGQAQPAAAPKFNVE